MMSSCDLGVYTNFKCFNFLQILFWDWRNGKQVACLEESHMEDVTQVCLAETYKE